MSDINVFFEPEQTPIAKTDVASAYLVSLLKEKQAELDKKNAVPKVDIKDKKLLTIEEAAELFGIGRNRLRELSNGDECSFVIWIGGHRKIKRDAFEEFLNKQFSI